MSCLAAIEAEVSSSCMNDSASAAGLTERVDIAYTGKQRGERAVLVALRLGRGGISRLESFDFSINRQESSIQCRMFAGTTSG